MTAATFVRTYLVVAGCMALACCPIHAQEDGGASYTRNEELLESIFIPYMPHAPFSLKLSTEWSKPMPNGGTFTTANQRPIMRDSVGRIYQERWALAPKDSPVASYMTWIQIADPIKHTLYECSARQHVCELLTLRDTTALRLRPERMTSGPLPNGTGEHAHKDLGVEFFAGLLVRHYRDTTKLNPGTMGNDLAMVTTRDYRFSEALGLNLSSVLDTPALGRQMFTVTEVTTTEPDPHYFLPPEGWRVVDHRAAEPAAE